MASTIGSNEDLEIQYGIDPNEGDTQYRLFVRGSNEPVVKNDSDDLVCILFHLYSKITWISKQAHLVPLPDCVTEISALTYNSFMKRNSYRSVMIMYYLPNYQTSQITLVQYQRAAYAFKVSPFLVSEA